ncbi:uncharacterized protein A4U43_C08F17760, partial [Asparagus officinalis]
MSPPPRSDPGLRPHPPVRHSLRRAVAHRTLIPPSFQRTPTRLTFCARRLRSSLHLQILPVETPCAASPPLLHHSLLAIAGAAHI